MDDSDDSKGGGKGEGGHTPLYLASPNAHFTAAEEGAEQRKGAGLSAARMSRSASRSRSGRRRVDSLGVHELSRPVKGAAVLGILLISVMALRFVICFGALRLYSTSRQGGVLGGRTPRRLGDDQAPLLTSAVPGGPAAANSVLGGACPGYFDNPAYDAGDEEQPEARTTAVFMDLRGDGEVYVHLTRAPATRRQILRALLRDTEAQLGLLVIGVCLVGLSSYVASRLLKAHEGALAITTQVSAALAFVMSVVLAYKVRQRYRASRYQRLRQLHSQV